MIFHIDSSMIDSGLAVKIELCGIPCEDGYDAGYAIDEPLTIVGEARYLQGGVEMEGNISGSICTECARCLTDVEYPVDVDFCEFFTDDGNEDAYPIADNETIPLDRMILEAISLSLPNRILCREDCRGLCPVCGNDLNYRDCGCERNTEIDSPFNKLKGLFDKDKEV